MPDIYNKNDNLDLRRKLRINATKSEAILWYYLKNKKFLNLKFKRQYGVDIYIVDFYCHQLRLAIEIDGGYHLLEEAKIYDRVRQEYIEDLGISFLRFTNEQIINDIKFVLKTIKNYANKKCSLSPIRERDRELGGRAEIKLAHFFGLIKAQSKGKEGILLVNGNANIAYIKGSDGNFWAVRAGWCTGHGDWDVEAYSVGRPYGWRAGVLVLSRDS